MTIEAPGTYHHSLVVANLAESAAEAIGANATLCRVCSYFHDVGKLVKPEYFTENMNFERNPHDDLAPTMSALIIIAHVKEGVDLALKHGLNQQVIDVIQQHHGTSLVFYFYNRALQQQEDARAGGKIMKMREEDIPEVSEESFRYSGPKPQTRESAIISLADMVESASRSLEKPTPAKNRATGHRADRSTPRRPSTGRMRADPAGIENDRGALPLHLDEHAAHAYRLSEGRKRLDDPRGRRASRCDGGNEPTGLRPPGLGRLTSGGFRDRAGARIWSAGCDCSRLGAELVSPGSGPASASSLTARLAACRARR